MERANYLPTTSMLFACIFADVFARSVAYREGPCSRPCDPSSDTRKVGCVRRRTLQPLQVCSQGVLHTAKDRAADLANCPATLMQLTLRTHLQWLQGPSQYATDLARAIGAASMVIRRVIRTVQGYSQGDSHCE